MGHRYYDPGTGRFLTRDPIGYGGGMNLYGYADGNPVNESDPSGFAPEEGKPGSNPFISEELQEDYEVAEEYGEMWKEREAGARSGSTGRALSLRNVLNPSGARVRALGILRLLRKNSFWKGITDFSGKKVYQRNDLIDPSRVDAKGRTSLQLMRMGQPPVGPDNKPLTMHHLTQDEEGPMAEMTQTFHDQYRRVIHISGSEEDSRVNRPVFNNWRKRYWRDRAKDYTP